MNVEVWGQTDVGLKRSINQDSILVDKSLGLFVVADGMGGHKGGEVASAMAVEAVRDVVELFRTSNDRSHPREILKEAYTQATQRIYDKSTKENPELNGMGTTLVCALLDGNKLYIGNVGDSRAYLYRPPHLWQLTEDHSLVNEQLRAGVITEDQINEVSGRNVITRSVGFERSVVVDIVEREVQTNEVVLLCSDGLCGLVEDSKIHDICAKNSIQNVVPKCIDAAKKAGGDDNISVVVVRFAV